MIRAVAAKGYAATTIQDIVGSAGVSRATFYEHFGRKEDCFLAAYMAGSEALFEATTAAGRGENDPVERLRLGTRAYLGNVAAETEWAIAGFTQVVAAGEAAVRARNAVMQWYVQSLQDWRRWAAARLRLSSEAPAQAFLASVCAIDELVASYVREGATLRVRELETPALYIELSLCGFASQAQGVLAEANGTGTAGLLAAARS